VRKADYQLDAAGKKASAICCHRQGRTGVAGAPRRIRDREHVKSVAKQACLVCGRRPADAHHLRFAQDRPLDGKVRDEFTVPLCRGHDREVHHSGDEATCYRTSLMARNSPAADDSGSRAHRRLDLGSRQRHRDLKSSKRHRPARNRNTVTRTSLRTDSTRLREGSDPIRSRSVANCEPLAKRRAQVR